MPNADIGANGAVWIKLEATYGTAEDPTLTGGVLMPVITEGLVYREEKYFSEQIRQETTASSVVAAPYHVEGDLEFEVDANYLPYLLYASRHTVTKTGSADPWTYSAVPSKIGSTYPGGSAKGLSIGVVRNAEGFLYNGCVVNNWAFTIDGGVLRCTASILGLGETTFDDSAMVGAWLDPELFGADAHSVFVDTAGTAPAFASRDDTFNGFTFTANHNGSPQNRIRPDRRASYIAYGMGEYTYDTELDFVSRAEYDNMKINTLRSVRLQSVRPGDTGTYAAATEAVRITAYRSAYTTYDVSLGSAGDLIMARVNGRALAIAGGSAYKIECKSAVSIT
jgi:hypothetical protein